MYGRRIASIKRLNRFDEDLLYFRGVAFRGDNTEGHKVRAEVCVAQACM
jgi:hypothetical protein